MAQVKKYRFLTKFLCLSCRRTFKRPVIGKSERPCPHCKRTAVRMGHKFRPPKLSARREWEVVAFLVGEGFYYDSIPIKDERGIEVGRISYPSTMDEAKRFVLENKEYASPQARVQGALGQDRQ